MTHFPKFSADSVGWLTTDQMIEVDRVMVEDLGITLFQMMENAGRNLARLAIDRFNTAHPVVAFGPGGNGGGGLVAARHLAVAGLDVCVVRATSSDLAEVPAAQLAIIERMGISVLDEIPNGADLIIDAILGYSLNGNPRGRAANVISAIEASPTPALSLDTPSGLDTATGVAMTPHITADATLTLALPKVGLRTHTAVGELFLANISVPGFVYDQMNAGPPPNFQQSPILHIAP